jgi:hypothetical protein
MTIEFKYLPAQYQAIMLPTFIKAIVGGYTSGKTYAICLRAIEYAFVHSHIAPGIYGAITSPSMPQAKKSVIPTMKSALAACGLIENVHWKLLKSSPLAFEILGVTIWIQSGALPDYLAGPTLGWAAIDEPFMQKRFVFNIMLSRVRDPRSTMRELMLAGTPEELNWGYDLLVTEEREDVSWVQVPTAANPYCPPEVIAVMKRTYDPILARAYLEGEFVILSGTAAYTSFSEKETVNAKAEFNKALPLVLCCDFNRSPMSWNIQHEPRATLLAGSTSFNWADTHVVDEIHIDGTSTRDAAAEFVRRYGRLGKGHPGPVLITGDYSGTAQSTKSDETDFTEVLAAVEKEWGANAMDLQIEPNPTHRARVNCTNAELLSHMGERHMFIHPRCTYTIRDYKSAVFAKGTKKLDKKKYDPHHADANDYRVSYKVQSIMQSVAA